MHKSAETTASLSVKPLVLRTTQNPRAVFRLPLPDGPSRPRVIVALTECQSRFARGSAVALAFRTASSANRENSSADMAGAFRTLAAAHMSLGNSHTLLHPAATAQKQLVICYAGRTGKGA